MKVVNVSFFYDENINDEEELIERHYTATGWAEALQTKGIESIVITRFKRDNHIVKNGVHYFFFKDNLGRNFKGWQIPYKFLKRIKYLRPDVIHLHHLTLSIQTVFLRLLLNKKTVIIIQHHGGAPPGRFKRTLHNFLLGITDGFFFTSLEQGKEWLIKKKYFSKIMPVMEGATFFNYHNRNKQETLVYSNKTDAKRKTGIHGEPVFIWVGNLIERKDPLTVINGFAELSTIYQKATLYMLYAGGDLAEEIERKISSSDILKKNVFLTGKISHEEIKVYYESADYFVLGSHAEGSGYALSEALCCGCVPIVTDIPSFKMMTNQGALGSLWKPGDKFSFIEAVSKALNKPQYDEALACIDFYKKNLSFDAIANTAIDFYQHAINKRSGKTNTKADLKDA